MPLPDCKGRVPVRPEDLGEEAVRPGWPAPVPGETDRQVGNPAHATAMVIPAREETGSSWRTQRRRVEVREPDSLGSHTVDHGSVDVGSVAPELREPHVVEYDQHDVGRTLRRHGTGGHQGSDVRQSSPIFPPNTVLAMTNTPRSLVPTRALHRRPTQHGPRRHGCLDAAPAVRPSADDAAPTALCRASEGAAERAPWAACWAEPGEQFPSMASNVPSMIWLD